MIEQPVMLTPKEVIEYIDFDRRTSHVPLIPREFLYAVNYDIDYDLIKLRLWKQIDGKIVSRRYILKREATRSGEPSYFSGQHEVIKYVSEVVTNFQTVTTTEDEEEAAHGGYIKGKMR